MTTTELLVALTQEYPNGISFDPMAVRLLRQKFPLEDWQIEELQAAMFQIEEGYWFSREMVIDDHSWIKLETQATKWLKEYGFFSIERLFENFRGVIHHVTTPIEHAALLQHLGLEVATERFVGSFCLRPSLDLNAALRELAGIIYDWLEGIDGTLACYEIEQALPYLATETLENMRVHFLPTVHKIEVGGIPCWRTTEAIILPEDFSEKIVTIVDTLDMLSQSVSEKNLEFALNLFYRIRFREEYGLLNTQVFMRICSKHYAMNGERQIIFRVGRSYFTDFSCSLAIQKNDMRSKNLFFCNLDIPIGGNLVFDKDIDGSCIVLDDTNQVEYLGKTWTISALANHLLGINCANSFCFFRYERETLWNRRLRLEQEEKQDTAQTTEISQSVKEHEAESGVVGLLGQALAASTWRAFRRDGTSPHVAEWAHRVANGESMEQIALESGYALPTMKGMISNYYLYFKVCKLNGIVPEGGANV